MTVSHRASGHFRGACVVMGVTSCGKTTIGAGIAEQLHVPFIEGDGLHSAESIAKMSAGTPLTDEDRWPWLARIGAAMRGNVGVVAACSALKKSYRAAIAKGAERPISLIFLSGSPDLLAQRMAARKGHFMPPSLLASQLAALEPPDESEDFAKLDIGRPAQQLVSEAIAFLTRKSL